MAPLQAPPAAAPCSGIARLQLNLCESWHATCQPFCIFLILFATFSNKHTSDTTPHGRTMEEANMTWKALPVDIRTPWELPWALVLSPLLLPPTAERESRCVWLLHYKDANCKLSMQPIRTGLCVAVWHVVSVCACSVAWNWNPWRRMHRGESSKKY